MVNGLTAKALKTWVLPSVHYLLPPGPDSVPSITAPRLGAAYQIGGAQNLDGSRQRGLRQGFYRGGGMLGAADVGRGQGCQREGVKVFMKDGWEGRGGVLLYCVGEPMTPTPHKSVMPGFSWV